MTALELPESDFEKALEVGREFSKGYSNKEIAAMFDMPRSDVRKYIEQYKEVVRWSAKNNQNVAERIQVVLEEVDDQYRLISREAWENKENAEAAGSFGQVNAALRLIADMQKNRMSMFQTLASEQDVELLERLNEQRETQEMILNILKGLKEQFPKAAMWVQKQLQDAQKDAVEVEVIDD